jgi:guanylate kinase
MAADVEGPRRGLMLVISSPSGAGKSSLSRRLIQEFPALTLSISCTTRDLRPGEENGREYHFVTVDKFLTMVMHQEFLEYAEVHENHYGTPKAPVMEALAAGKDVLFDIDWQGAEKIARQAPQDTIRVFILPPSMEALAERLHGRAQDSEEVIARRLSRARGEIEKWSEYDYVLVNDDFDRCYGELVQIYRAERLKRARNAWLGPFVERLIEGS